ncbi:MAG: hypothetical protein ACPH5G_02875, partial [Pseudooceanicola atlanticus]
GVGRGTNLYRLQIIKQSTDMDSDDDYYDDGDLYDDSGNESPEVEDGSEEEENFIMDAGFEDEPSGSSSQKIEEEYHFEVVLNETK